jgi:hypothetical protein
LSAKPAHDEHRHRVFASWLVAKGWTTGRGTNEYLARWTRLRRACLAAGLLEF